MANHKSAEKANRQAIKKNARNSRGRTEIRTAVKEVRVAAAKGDAKTAATAFVTAQKKLAKGATKGLVKKNAAARLTSRLNAAVKKAAGK